MTRCSAFRVVDARIARYGRSIELVQRSARLSQSVLVEDVEHLLHGLETGLWAANAYPLEEGVEDGSRDEVLGEHLDRSFAAGDDRLMFLRRP